MIQNHFVIRDHFERDFEKRGAHVGQSNYGVAVIAIYFDLSMNHLGELHYNLSVLMHS